MLDYERVRLRGGKVSLGDALQSLRPGAVWAIQKGNLSTLDWMEPVGGQKRPSNEKILDEQKKLQELYDNYKYKFDRKEEYPDFSEYLDGLVKGDTEQMQAYIDKCLEVKAKYPKPE
jgi:hypothetical protein